MTELSTRLASRLHLDDDQPCAVVYDLQALSQRAQALRQAMPDFVHCLALKAAPLSALVERFADWGFGFEAASFSEGWSAHRCRPDVPLLFDSPAKTRSEIERAQALGWILSVNSLAELERVSQPCSLRINTLTGAGHIAHTSVAHRGSRFGLPHDALPEQLKVAGLHAHIGSQGCSLEQLVCSARRLVDLAKDMPSVSWLNIGGGLPAHGDFAEYGQALRHAVPELFERRWRVYTEMGRSLLATTARAYSRVEYVSADIATIHLGADFLLRRVYRPQDWDYPMRALDANWQARVGPTRDQTIAGPLCFAGDVLGTLKAPAIESGDIIEIADVGAYTLSMWSRHCSRPMPAVWGLEADDRLVLLSAGERDSDIAKLWQAP